MLGACHRLLLLPLWPAPLLGLPPWPLQIDTVGESAYPAILRSLGSVESVARGAAEFSRLQLQGEPQRRPARLQAAPHLRCPARAARCRRAGWDRQP